MAQGLMISNQDAAFLISIMGISSTISRVIAGFIVDKPWMDAVVATGVLMIIMGIMTVALPFCRQYILLALYCVVNGIASGNCDLCVLLRKFHQQYDY